MASTLDDLGFVPAANYKVGDLSDLGFVPAKPPPLKLPPPNPLQQVEMQSMATGRGIDPENTGATAQALLQGNSDIGLQEAAPGIVAAEKGLLNAVQTPVTDWGTTETPEDAIRHARAMGLAADVSPVEDTQSPSEIGAQEGMGNLMSAFLSPLGIATTGMGGLPTAAQRAISLGFAAQMAKDTPEIARELGTEMGKNPEDRDEAKIADLTTQGIGNTIFAAMAGAHGLAPTEEAPAAAPEQSGAPQAVEPATIQPNAATTAPELSHSSLDDLGFVPDVPQEQTPLVKALATHENVAPTQPSAQAAPVKTAPAPAPGAPVSIPSTSNEAAKANIDPASAFVFTPDGKVDPVPTAIARMKLQGNTTEPLTGQPSNAINQPAAPGTDTVRTAGSDAGNASQRGQFPAEPATVAAQGVTAEGGSNPPLGAAASSQRRSLRSESGRPFDLIDHIEGEVGTIDPTLIRQENPNWKPVGAARKLFKKGGIPADTALNGITYGGDVYGLRRDTPIDEFGDAVNKAAAARKTWRKQFYQEERTVKEQSKQTVTFQKDIAQESKGTVPLVPDDLNEGDSFTLKGAKLKVSRLDFDEDGRVTGLELSDGKKYGTQEVDGQTALRMDEGSHVQKPVSTSFTEKAEGIAQKLESLKSGIAGGTSGQMHLFGVVPDVWDKAVGLAQYLIRSGGKVADAINEAIRYIKKNFAGPFDEAGARQHFQGALNQYVQERSASAKKGSEYIPGEGEQSERQPETEQNPGASETSTKTPAGVEREQSSYERYLARRAAEKAAGSKIETTLENLGKKGAKPSYEPKFSRPLEINDVQPKGAASATATQTQPEEPAPAAEVPPEPGSRPVATVKADIAKSEADLKTALQNRPGKGKAGTQQVAQATAKYRNLRDELLNHPEYVAENLKAHNDAVTEANAILKPLGMAVRADDFPNPAILREKLSPEQLKRFEELSKTISDTHAELNRMPKKLVSSVHAQMEKDGRLPKSPSVLEGNAGRTLAQMTEFLRSNKLDSPRATLMERLAIGKRAAEAVTKTKDAFTKATARAQAVWKGMKGALKSPPIDSDYRSALKSWISYDDRTAMENYQYAKTITGTVRQALRRRAIAVWLDAGGDESLLRAQSESVPAKYKEIWDTALKLTPDEKRIARDIKSNFDLKMRDAIDLGLMDKGRENYGVPQRWKTPPQTGEADPFGETKRGTPGNPHARLDTRDPFFSFDRKTPSYYDGIMAGGEPENLDVAHLVTIYDEAFHKTLGSRGWVGALKDALAKDGQPVVKISGSASMNRGGDAPSTFIDSKSLPKDAVTADGRFYRAFDHPALKGWRFASKDAAGNPIYMKGDMLIHPDHFEDVKRQLDSPRWLRKLAPGETRSKVEAAGYRALRISAFLKASKFIGPFHVVTEALHASTHGVAGVLSDITHGDISGAWKRKGQLSPSVRGFQIDLNDPQQASLARNMTLGFGRAREMFEDGLSSHGGIWAKFPALGDMIVRMNSFTFNEYIPRLKMKVGLAVLDRNTADYGGKLTPEQIAELTGRQMDAAFGGQNWRLLGHSQNTVGVLRLLAVAPDFLISRAKVIGQAMKPYNAEQRRFLVAQAVGVFLFCRALNYAFSDNHDPHWEPQYWDAVIIGGRVYRGRFLVSDASSFARDILGYGKGGGLPFISGRLGVIPKTAIEAVTGRDMFSGREIFPGHHGIANSFAIVCRDVAQWMTPMAVDGFISGKSKGQTGPGQVVAALTGVSSYPINPEKPQRTRESKR